MGHIGAARRSERSSHVTKWLRPAGEERLRGGCLRWQRAWPVRRNADGREIGQGTSYGGVWERTASAVGLVRSYRLSEGAGARSLASIV